MPLLFIASSLVGRSIRRRPATNDIIGHMHKRRENEPFINCNEGVIKLQLFYWNVHPGTTLQIFSSRRSAPVGWMLLLGQHKV